MKTSKSTISRTYRLSEESVKTLERLSKEFSKKLGTQIPYSRLVDSLICYCKDLSFNELVKKIEGTKKHDK